MQWSVFAVGHIYTGKFLIAEKLYGCRSEDMEYVKITSNNMVGNQTEIKTGASRGKAELCPRSDICTLRQIEAQKGYEQDGYKSIAEFAQKDSEFTFRPLQQGLSKMNREYSIDGYSWRLARILRYSKKPERGGAENAG